MGIGYVFQKCGIFDDSCFAMIPGWRCRNAMGLGLLFNRAMILINTYLLWLRFSRRTGVREVRLGGCLIVDTIGY